MTGFVRHASRLRHLLLALAMTAATPLAAGAQIQVGTTISLADGQVQGHVNDVAREFLGIPYALPPVGALRWRPPVPNDPWIGVLDASAYPPACAQLDSSTSDPSATEDCLYLNVWTPDPAPAEPLPVLVWIHGGGDVSGASGNFVPFPPYESYRLYDAHNLAGDRNVVVVSLNYRLGVFGFFGHPTLATEDPGHPYAGNQGLLDQRLALQWVRDNILAFGGDPGNVTIFGESAGAWNVCAHVASPLSSGLFHRAISQSGGCTAGIATAAESAAAASDIAVAVGCDGAPDVLACLRAAPVGPLLDAFGNFELEGTPIAIDGAFLPAHPRTLFDSGAFARVPYMLGFNSDEGTLFFIGATPVTTPAEYTAALTARYGPLAPSVEAIYPVTSFPTPQDALVRVVGDATLVCPTLDVARRVSAAKNPRVYVYNFARVIPLPFVSLLDLGAFHGAEIPYVFNSVPAPNVFDDELGNRMQQYWTSFAVKGRNPRATKSTPWPRFKERPWRMLRFDVPQIGNGVTTAKSFRRTECEFWSEVYALIE